MSKLPRTALAVSASAAAALAAYGLGTQSDGSATAADRNAASVTPDSVGSSAGSNRFAFRDERRGGRAALASELGVTSAQLRAALTAIREENSPRADKRTELAAAVAKELDLSTDEVVAALEKLEGSAAMRPRDGGHHRSSSRAATALASELGVTAAKLRAAFTKAHEARHAARTAERAKELAALLDVDQAKVAAALETLDEADGREGRGHHGGPGREARAADLAEELGIEESKVTAALDTLEDRREAEHAAERTRFAEQLAGKLDLSKEKVTAALDEAPFGGHRGFGGPHHR